MIRSMGRRLVRRALVVNNELDANSATARAARALIEDLTAREVDVLTSHAMSDAAAIAASDASLQVITATRRMPAPAIC